MPMRIFLALLVIALGWITQGCTNEADRNAIRQMEQAAPLMQSDPEAAHALLADSVAHPELLSPEVNARWCLMLCQLADSIGTPLPLMDDLDRARYYWERKGSPHDQALADYYLGRALMEEGLWKQSLTMLLKAGKLSLQSNDINLSGYITSNIGMVYYNQADFLLAKDKFLEAASYFEKAGNKRSYVFALVNTAHMYTAMDSTQAAFSYMHKADSLSWALRDSSDLFAFYNNYGNIYASLGYWTTAKKYFYQSIAYSPKEAAPTYSALGGIYLETDCLEQAERCFEKAKEATDNPYTHVELFHHFAELEEKKGNLSQALSLIKQYVDSTETEIQRTKETNLAKAETLFNRKEMLHENFKLRKERENISSYLVGTVFVLLLLSVFYVYRLGRKNRRIIQLTDELQEQKSHLLEQQMALDSLSCQLKAAQQDNLEELRQKQSEYDQKAQEVELLKQQYLQQRQYLLRESTIYKKIQKSVSTPNPDHKELLTDKDWKVIYKCIDTMYPSLSERLVLAGITPTEKKYCYLSFFQLDSKQEAFLLNVNIDTPYKNRTRIRQKLKITGSEEKLYEHLALWG
mgnify:FL=1